MSIITLVETIPADIDLPSPAGVQQTGNTLLRLVNQAQHSIDLSAMYWSLLPNPHSIDESGFSLETLLHHFGGEQGTALFAALETAVQRGVRLRILQSTGFGEAALEPSLLQAANPAAVSIRQIDMRPWYDGGIMHHKLWIFDAHTVYVGSANTDWRSLSQVKELGVVVANDTTVAADFTRFFEAWWQWSQLPPSPATAFDPASHITRTVPTWSPLVPASQRQPNPLDQPELQALSSWQRPLPNGNLFLSAAPQEICLGQRTFDGDAWLKTILTAETAVCLSVMDFAPISTYRGHYDPDTGKMMLGDAVATAVWWPDIFDALLHATLTKGLHVRLLISQWAHTPPTTQPFLQALQQAANAAQASTTTRSGTLQIRRMRLPGWDSTLGDNRTHPGHSRVNHAKYLVTDQRAHISTSNLTWDYFHASGGASLNTTHPPTVQTLQAIFDRDWQSPYASEQ